MMESLAGVAAGVIALFGGPGGGDHKLPPPPQRQLHATTTATGSVDIACVAAAVAAREAALGTAVSANGQALSSAYTDRASALASAYAQSSNEAIRKGIKTASTNFGAALRLAQKSWKGAQQKAWTDFRTAVKACGAGATSISDSSNASIDAVAGAGSDN